MDLKNISLKNFFTQLVKNNHKLFKQKKNILGNLISEPRAIILPLIIYHKNLYTIHDFL